MNTPPVVTGHNFFPLDGDRVEPGREEHRPTPTPTPLEGPMTVALCTAYIAVIVAANLTLNYYGPAASPYVAFAAIGLVLVLRDRLHRIWQGRQLAARMGGLILLGGAVSALVTSFSQTSLRIAAASVLAFLVAEALDAVTFHKARGRVWIEQSNLSNIVGAAADSIVFVYVAFGGPWQIVALQFIAKVAGGLVWSFLLAPRQARLATA